MRGILQIPQGSWSGEIHSLNHSDCKNWQQGGMYSTTTTTITLDYKHVMNLQIDQHHQKQIVKMHCHLS